MKCTGKPHFDTAFIIPVKNEGQTVEGVLSSVHRHFPEACICVVVNGSTDSSYARCIRFFRARNFHESRYRVLLIEQGGKARAVSLGLQSFTASYYVLIDSDSQHDPEQVKQLISVARSAQADMVIGSRFMHKKPFWQSGNLRQRFNLLYNTLARFLFGIALTDVLSGIRVLSRPFVESLHIASQNFELEVELLIHLLRGNFKAAEVGVSTMARPRKNDAKLHLFMDGFKILMFTFVQYFRMDHEE